MISFTAAGAFVSSQPSGNFVQFGGTDDEAQDERDGAGDTLLGKGLGHDHRGEDGDRADREVDAGGEDHQGLCDRDGSHDRHLLSDERKIRDGPEAVVQQAEDDDREDQHDERRGLHHPRGDRGEDGHRTRGIRDLGGALLRRDECFGFVEESEGKRDLRIDLQELAYGGFQDYLTLAVRPGDVLRIEVEVIEVRSSNSRPTHGLVKTRAVTLNQKDEPVQVQVTSVFVPRRAR